MRHALLKHYFKYLYPYCKVSPGKINKPLKFWKSHGSLLVKICMNLEIRKFHQKKNVYVCWDREASRKCERQPPVLSVEGKPCKTSNMVTNTVGFTASAAVVCAVAKVVCLSVHQQFRWDKPMTIHFPVFLYRSAVSDQYHCVSTEVSLGRPL